MNKLYVVRKYVYAKNAREAIRKERGQNVDDVWLDDDWRKMNTEMTQGKNFNVNKK
jgi:hypothetical protein